MAPRCSWEELHRADLPSPVAQPSCRSFWRQDKGAIGSWFMGLLGEALDGLLQAQGTAIDNLICWRQHHPPDALILQETWTMPRSCAICLMARAS